MKSITKKVIVHEVAEKTGCSLIQTRAFMDAFLESIVEHLVARDRVNIDGFGTFDVMVRSARKGRNPQTGESIDIPEALNPRLKFGKDVKEAVNQE